MSPLCGVRAIYILALCISSSVFDFPLTSNVGDRSLNPKCTYLGCLSPVHCGARGRWHSMLTRHLSLWWYLYPVRVSIRVWGALVWGVLGWSWGGFAHVATVDCCGVCEISLWLVGYVLSRSASDFGRVSGLVRVSLVGQAPELWNLHMYVNSHDQNIFLSFCFCSESLLFACSIMSCHVGNKLYWIELKRLRKQPSKQMLCKFSGKN